MFDEIDRVTKHSRLCASDGRTGVDRSDPQKNDLGGYQEDLQDNVPQVGGEKRLRCRGDLVSDEVGYIPPELSVPFLRFVLDGNDEK